MNEPPDDPLSPSAWLKRAQSSLRLARLGGASDEIMREDVVFQIQQAAEKALKGALVARGVHFPKTHVLGELITLLAGAGVIVPPSVQLAAKLTAYAVRTRYPGGSGVTQADYEEGIRIADDVVAWAQSQIEIPL